MRTSPCCGGVIWRFNARRRQCRSCQKTWTVRRRKRGRKRRWQRARFSYRVLREHRSLRRFAEHTAAGREKVRLRFHRSLKSLYRSSPNPAVIPPGPLIAIADALHAHCGKEKVTIPMILLRPVVGHTAVLAILGVLKGGETAQNWSRAFAALPPNLHARIVALVSDDGSGLRLYARTQEWLVQLCNFHLLARFRPQIGTRKWVRLSMERRQIWQLLLTVSKELDPVEVQRALRRMQAIVDKTSGLPPALRTFTKGFIKHWRDYRTYLDRPDLNLPDTTNSAESTARLVRNVLRERGGFRTIGALRRWLAVIKKLHPTITCNKANHLQN